MQYDGLAWTFALIALLALLVAARILFDRHWFLGWLRGCAGLAFVAAALALGLAAWDLRSYDALPAERPLATLSFQRLAPQRYEVKILEGDRERRVELGGDLWQLDVRIMQWRGLAALIGLDPGYRLQGLAGRYLAIEQQQAQARQQTLAQSPYGFDLWRWLRDGQHDLLTFRPLAARVNFLPMADQAVYSVRLGPAGLEAEPVNAAAQQALREWR
ncbi:MULTISPECIES: hypothetical protein [unclassified Pseudomonas]|jgi:hypothetical protein|uniref:hypothetical protein n=1 Tax=unclassified Pseudomonas TaxID=196821 RepID=UPI0007302CFB|nr:MULTISPECIES: hypothetical protein [unclassified Pseudomonas]KSW27220.1 hypothetical protein AOX63_26955 [Pseudomonas sp. ADP]OBP09917.1 hypothetical protein BAE52_17220 [Pseudomonas sp. EGD-AKN5]QOF83882.1 hypothetical protein IG194_25515 [Pseudomonas sp. ADPe]